MLQEPENIVLRRETLKKMLDILKNCRKILMRDPE
jgi:hypothetical protein